MSSLPPDRGALDRLTAAAGPAALPAPATRSRRALECPSCGASFASRAAFMWHRLNAHLRVSNELGNSAAVGTIHRAADGAACDAAGSPAARAAPTSDGCGADVDAARAAAVPAAADGIGRGGAAVSARGASPPDGAAGGGGDGAALGGAADAPADGGEAAPESAAAQAALDPTNNISTAVAMELRALLQLTRKEVDTSEPARKRRRIGTMGPVEKDYTYSTVSTAMRACYEDEGDWERAVPIVERRKGWRLWHFHSFRLRAVQLFALESGGPGLSLQWLEEL